MAAVVKTWASIFAEGLHLTTREKAQFVTLYDKVLEADEKHASSRYTSYAAALAYSVNIQLKLGKTQEEIAGIALCSRDAVSSNYRPIVKRNREFFSLK